MYSMYRAASRSLPKTGNLLFGPTEQLRRRTTRFSRALEVYSRNDPVPGSEVYRGTEHEIMKIAISHTNVDRYGAPGTVFSINADNGLPRPSRPILPVEVMFLTCILDI